MGIAAAMKNLPLSEICQVFESDSLVLLTTAHKSRTNIMTMSKHM
jgi:hypothetical protein